MPKRKRVTKKEAEIKATYLPEKPRKKEDIPTKFLLYRHIHYEDRDPIATFTTFLDALTVARAIVKEQEDKEKQYECYQKDEQWKWDECVGKHEDDAEINSRHGGISYVIEKLYDNPSFEELCARYE